MLNSQSNQSSTKIFTNILVILLLAGNIYLSIQYVANIRRQNTEKAADVAKNDARTKTANVLTELIDMLLKNKDGIKYDDRLKLESDLLQIHDPEITSQWNKFLLSESQNNTQQSLVELMSMLSHKLI